MEGLYVNGLSCILAIKIQDDSSADGLQPRQL
jgi:hypothetical protein